MTTYTRSVVRITLLGMSEDERRGERRLVVSLRVEYENGASAIVPLMLPFGGKPGDTFTVHHTVDIHPSGNEVMLDIGYRPVDERLQ